MAVSDYKVTPDQNTTISGINIAEGCPPSGINNAIRQMMADIKAKTDAMDTASGTKDAAQDTAIAAAQSKADAALPKTGGVMTGPIQTESLLGRSTGTDKSVNITGGTSLSNGALLILRGKDQAPGNGHFELTARTSDSNTCTLAGSPEGTLTWGGKDVLTSDYTPPPFVPTSLFQIQSGDDPEGAEIQLLGHTSSQRTVGIDNLSNQVRFIFYRTSSLPLRVITFNVEANPSIVMETATGQHNLPLSIAPSTRYINIGYQTSYTAPADGFIAYRCNGTDAGDFMILSASMEISSQFGNNGNGSFAGYVPVRKGETVIMSAKILGQWFYVRFIYAEGSY